MNEPMGLLGWVKAGSSAATSVWVTTVATDRSMPACRKVVLQVLRERVADGALRVGTADVEGDLVQLVGGQLRAAQDEPDLRAVAVA